MTGYLIQKNKNRGRVGKGEILRVGLSLVLVD